MSSDEEIGGAFGSLWDDMKAEETFPQKRLLLAHYTSIATLEGIMANDQLWFSNPLFMNDLDELAFGILESAKIIRKSQEIKKACGTEEWYKLFQSIFESYLDDFSVEHAFDVYVLCFSDHTDVKDDGLLSMWRGYGGNGNGAAIIFDTQQLNYNEDSPFIVSKVEYNSTEERIKWIENKCIEFSAILKNTNVPDDKLYLPVGYLFERMKIFSIFTKHAGFSEEREWRAVYIRERDTKRKLDEMLHYAIGRNGVEPKLKFKVKPVDGITADDFSLEKIVSKIILGPTVSSPLALSAVKRMLEKNGKSEIAKKLVSSTTPFRG
ncbi:DUF2971 domain-containing protein [Pseudomonas sp. UW4]|uniref:DUF2971 domain-containing protein n=1 Tax=Pseudomonas sp. UW4 TaxID=1207075 RepID=UPI00029D209C|nr:DUF2971 domain-containing protein [Pseudomonas sp. UW4]AFY20776.1 hypothetical protein PputUW4_03584 [Pseudomonas sp. UW4]